MLAVELRGHFRRGKCIAALHVRLKIVCHYVEAHLILAVCHHVLAINADNGGLPARGEPRRSAFHHGRRDLTAAEAAVGACSPTFGSILGSPVNSLQIGDFFPAVHSKLTRILTFCCAEINRFHKSQFSLGSPYWLRQSFFFHRRARAMFSQT